MKLKITVHGVAYEVDVEVLDAGEGFPMPSSLPAPPMAPGAPAAAVLPPVGARPPVGAPVPSAAGGSGLVKSPVAGTVQEVLVKPGENFAKGQTLIVIEAMKMNTSITAPDPGTARSVPVAVGDAVREEQTLVEYD